MNFSSFVPQFNNPPNNAVNPFAAKFVNGGSGQVRRSSTVFPYYLRTAVVSSASNDRYGNDSFLLLYFDHRAEEARRLLSLVTTIQTVQQAVKLVSAAQIVIKSPFHQSSINPPSPVLSLAADLGPCLWTRWRSALPERCLVARQ